MRAGRKRKSGNREANGRLKRPTDAERSISHRRLELMEKQTVLSQPHRNGDEDQLLESPLGRFVVKLKLPRAFYVAGVEYGVLVRRYYAAKGIPAPHKGSGGGSGRGVSPSTALWLARVITRIDRQLRPLGLQGFAAMRDLAVEEREIAMHLEPITAKILRRLEPEMGKLGYNLRR